MSDPVDRFLATFHARRPIRAGSLIVTVFGDAVVPRGGSLSLASLTRIMAGFRIGDGLVRTALSRLVAEGWFRRQRRGRNSFYELTPRGHADFGEAARRIYGPRRRDWDGAFDIVLLDDERDRRRGALLDFGYGSLSPGLLVAPGAITLDKSLLRLAARPVDIATARRLAERAWPLAEVAERYRGFIAAYRDLPASIATAAVDDDLAALVLRILLVHDYRRVVLKDPGLPDALLPESWSGFAARELVAASYRLLGPASEAWLDVHATGWAGALPAPSRALGGRFEADCGELPGSP